MSDAYRDFLRAKIKLAASAGFEIEASAINLVMKPIARAIAHWALRGGRRAIFASFGLHKTSMQLEIMRQIGARTGLPTLIVMPLDVRHEFFAEHEARGFAALGMRVKFIKSTAEIEDGDVTHFTNYESVRDGKIDTSRFVAASLDEAAVLRGFGGSKTFREFMRLFEGVKYRFVATATPSPNEFIELLAYAAFLDIMDVGEAKTRFFKRDSTNADKLTLHPHKEREFWLWCASWAMFVQRPSDLGFSDDGYDMPPLDIRWHELPSDNSTAGAERDGQGRLFKDSAAGVVEASREKRDSLSARVAKFRGVIADERRAAGLSEAILRGEQADAFEETARAEQYLLSREQRESEGQEQSLAARQSGSLQSDDGQIPSGKPREGKGSKCALVSGEQSPRASAMPQTKIEGLRADSGRVRSDALSTRGEVQDLHHDDDVASSRSLPQDGEGSRSSLPAMQHGIGDVRGRSPTALERDRLPDQIVVWCDLNDEQRALEVALEADGISYSSLYGAQGPEDREPLLIDWKAKRTSAFLTKPQMFGAGINLQQSHTMIFVGIGFKFAQFIQAIHRIQRFGQTHQCVIHLIYTEAEREVRKSLENKWASHRLLMDKMGVIIREFGLAQASLEAALGRSMGVGRQEVSGENYRLIYNDSVLEAQTLESDSVDLIVTSIPFATQYEYTPNYCDFGHTDDNAHFWAQMDFLIPELLRALKPGRVAAIHTKDRITPGGLNGYGFQTVEPFSDQCGEAFRKHGFAFLARKTITTDVVRENNQTYRLGWSEQCKDGTRMGCGMPEYLMIFRKPPTDRSNGYADDPVVKDKPLCFDANGQPAPFDKKKNWKKPVPGTGYSRSQWQLDAHGYAKSSGNRLLSSAELATIPHEQIFKWWRERDLGRVYDAKEHVRVAETIDLAQRLPATFMLLPPHSDHPDVWSDITRMRTLNGAQHAAGREMHLCPLQLDIADRVIVQFSMPGETVFDPFAGIGTVPYCALKLGRRGLGIELSDRYFPDAVFYCREAERAKDVPTLFDMLDAEDADPTPMAAE